MHLVPEKYRAAVIIIDESSEEYTTKAAGKPTAQNEELSVQETAGSRIRGRRPLSLRLMISAVISVGIFVLMIFLSKLPELRKEERVRTITRNSLIATLSLYLILAHAKDVMTVFGIMGSAVEEVRQHSAEKGKKAAKAIKSLDALFEEAQLEKERGDTDQSRQ